MGHYRQIIINFTVEDNTEEIEIENLSEKICSFVEEQADKDIISDIRIQVN